MRLIFILLVYFPLTTYSQVQESFDDGDYNSSPIWTGTDEYFIINTSNELQLNDTDARFSFLSTPSQAIEEGSWQFRVKLGFNPSSGNYTQIYLASDNEQLYNSNNAIFVELGSAKDNICLYKIENGTKKKLIEGVVDRLDLSAVDVVVRITRIKDDWTLECDMGDGWIQEGQANFEFNHPSSYFGIFCKYTKTRANKFFFDDIWVEGLPYRDKTPPEITAFELVNGTQIRLTFNEALDESSLSNNDFILKKSQRLPSGIIYNNDELTITLLFEPILEDIEDEQLLVSNILDTDENSIIPQTFPFSYERIKVNAIKLLNRTILQLSFTKEVPIEAFNNFSLVIDNISVKPQNISTDNNYLFTVHLPETLENGRQYKLEISGLIDAINDPVPDISIPVMHYDANRFDVVINEWMADPSPSMGLPEKEFVELFNNSSYAINFSGWTLKVNEKMVLLPDSIIEANGYICLVSAADMDDWNTTLPTAFVKSMPALNNSGFELSISNQNKTVIDAFIYHPTTIRGEGFKNEGGWSVERIDTNNKSGSMDNYHWAMDLNGGTPGRQNSVSEKNVDLTAPFVTSLKLAESKVLHIDFSETMDFNDFKLEITPKLAICNQNYDTVFLKHLKIEFADKLTKNAIYQLNSIEISDLADNNLLQDDAIVFGVPDTLEHDDLLINEVLFNPYPGSADFVEIYNTSDKLLNLSDLYFAEIKEETIEKLHQACTATQMLLPQSYVAITTDKESILEHYQCHQPKAIVEASSLPSYPDDEGHVVITNKKGIVLDEFRYHQNMHFDLLKEKEGVSLERLSWEQATQKSTNWQSAASTAGFATPGYINSQQLSQVIETSGIVSVAPEVFTPNGDGINDRIQIQIKSDEANTMATIRIYDVNGKEVRYLINNQSLSNSNYFTWDGLSDNRSELHPGIYLIFVQCVYPSGKVHKEKLSCVIGIESN